MIDVSLSEEALADAAQAADWYIDQGAWSAAVAFQVELTEALARLALTPGLGTPGPEGTRILPLHRFPVSLIYRQAGEHELRVIAVAAQRRRPGHWSGRR